MLNKNYTLRQSYSFNSNKQTKNVRGRVEFVNSLWLAKLCHSKDPVAATLATIALLAIERLDAGGGQ